MPVLLYSMPLTLWQAAVNPCIRQRLLDTHRKVWLSLLWGHCSLLLGPCVHKVMFWPSKCLLPQSCGSSIIKSHWPPKSNYLGVLSPLLDPQVGKSVAGPRTFLTENLFGIIILQSVGCLLGGSMVGLMVTSSNMASATGFVTQVCCSQSPCPHGRSLLTCASTGDTQTLKGKSGSVSVGPLGPGVHRPSKCLCWLWGLILSTKNRCTS